MHFQYLLDLFFALIKSNFKTEKKKFCFSIMIFITISGRHGLLQKVLACNESCHICHFKYYVELNGA